MQEIALSSLGPIILRYGVLVYSKTYIVFRFVAVYLILLFCLLIDIFIQALRAAAVQRMQILKGSPARRVVSSYPIR